MIYAAGVVVTVVIAGAAWRRSRTMAGSHDERRHNGRLVGIASGIEGLAIFLAINVLANIHRPDLVGPVVAVIVGLHFVPLARWLPAPLYYVTSALLVVIGIAGLGIHDSHVRLFAVSVGAASILWLTCAGVLWYGRLA